MDREFDWDDDRPRDRDDGRDDDWDDDRDDRGRRFEFPDDPELGERVVNGFVAYEWDGRRWVRASAGRRQERPVIAVQRRPPQRPILGTMWYHPRDHKLEIWIGRWAPVGGNGNFLSLHEQPRDKPPWRVRGDVRFDKDVRVAHELLTSIFTLREGWAEEEEHRDRERDRDDQHRDNRREEPRQ